MPNVARGRNDPEIWVRQHGNDLFRFALMRVCNRPAAEDLVQDTFVSALASREDGLAPLPGNTLVQPRSRMSRVETMDAIKKWLRSLRLCLMPRCGEISRLSSRSLDGPLSFGERLSVRLHFVTCLWCRRYNAQLRFLRRVFQKRVGSAKVQLTPEAKERMEQKIREHASDLM